MYIIEIYGTTHQQIFCVPMSRVANCWAKLVVSFTLSRCLSLEGVCRALVWFSAGRTAELQVSYPWCHGSTSCLTSALQEATPLGKFLCRWQPSNGHDETTGPSASPHQVYGAKAPESQIQQEQLLLLKLRTECPALFNIYADAQRPNRQAS